MLNCIKCNTRVEKQAESGAACRPINVVGNICETGTILVEGRIMPVPQEDDVPGVLDSGACGMTMSFTCNCRLLPSLSYGKMKKHIK